MARSVVKVEGISCQRILDGSGFAVGPDLIVTNAHVVAGEPSTTVIRDDGRRLGATVVAYDPERDLALLSVPHLDRPALTLSSPTVGQRGGVFGHPGGAPLRVAPFQIARRITAASNDIYGRHQVDRQVLELAVGAGTGRLRLGGGGRRGPGGGGGVRGVDRPVEPGLCPGTLGAAGRAGPAPRRPVSTQGCA